MSHRNASGANKPARKSPHSFGARPTKDFECVAPYKMADAIQSPVNTNPSIVVLGMLLLPNVNRSPRQTAATRGAPAAVWRRAGGLVGRYHSSAGARAKPAVVLVQMA
jgi:hypothetical protein